MSDSPSNALPGKLGEALTESLRSGETLLTALHTSAGEAIAATDRRVIILKAGPLSGAGIFGRKAISFPYDTITSVEHRRGPLGGHIEILAAGVLPSPTKGIFETVSNVERENVVTYNRQFRNSVVATIALIQEHVDKARAAKSQPPASAGLAEQIAKLHALKEQGALTEAEFASAKAQLLNRLT